MTHGYDMKFKFQCPEIQFLMPSVRNSWADIFLSYISTYTMASMLLLGPQSPKYLLCGPVHKDFAALGLATQLPKGPDLKTSDWVSMNRKWWGVSQSAESIQVQVQTITEPSQTVSRLALAFRVPTHDPPGFPAGVRQQRAPTPATCVPGPSPSGGRPELWAGVRH